MVSFSAVGVFTLIVVATCQRDNTGQDGRRGGGGGGGRNDDSNRGGGGGGGGRGRKSHKYDPALTQELNDCHDEIDTYSDCMKGQVELKKQRFVTEQGEDFKKKIADCFTLSGCEYKTVEQLKPVEDPVATAKLAKFDEFWGRLDSTRQNCFTKEVRDEFVDKLNTCVGKSAPSYKLPVTTDGVTNAQDDQTKGRKVAHDRGSIRSSLRACNKKGGRNSKVGNKIRQCISDLRKPLQQPSCDLKEKCTAAMSKKCLKALEQLKQISCKCLEQQHRAIGAKLSAVKSNTGRRGHRVKAGTDDSADLVTNIQKSCNIEFSSDIANAADNIPASLQSEAAEYVDAQAESEIGFCNVCGKDKITEEN